MQAWWAEDHSLKNVKNRVLFKNSIRFKNKNKQYTDLHKRAKTSIAINKKLWAYWDMARGAIGQSCYPQKHVSHFVLRSLSSVLVDCSVDRGWLKALSFAQFFSGPCCSNPSLLANYKCWSIETVTFFETWLARRCRSNRVSQTAHWPHLSVKGPVCGEIIKQPFWFQYKYLNISTYSMGELKRKYFHLYSSEHLYWCRINDYAIHYFHVKASKWIWAILKYCTVLER